MKKIMMRKIMMRKIIVVFVLIAEFSFAQFRYKVEMDVNASLNANEDTFSSADITLRLASSNNQSVIFYTLNLVNTLTPTKAELYRNEIIELSNKANKILVNIDQFNFFNNPNCNNIISEEVVFRDYNCTVFYTSDQACFSSSRNHARLYRIEKLQDLNRIKENNQLKTCESRVIKIANSNCTPNDKIWYELRYSLGNESNRLNKVLLPYGLHPVTYELNFSDIENLNVGQNLRLQVRYTDNANNPQPSSKPDDFSDIISLTTISCSPKLEGPVVTQKTSCSYEEDGSFTLNFDRDLNSGERLAITLFNQDGAIPAGGQILNIPTLNNKSYTWPNNLPAGNYTLKYQSHTGGLSGNDPSWTGSSLEAVNFVIIPAAPVDFSVFGSADENCFEAKDGYIDLRATREGSRQLFYQYSIDGGTYSSWFPFSIGNETRINGLGKGEYKIKVKDSNGCLAK